LTGWEHLHYYCSFRGTVSLHFSEGNNPQGSAEQPALAPRLYSHSRRRSYSTRCKLYGKTFSKIKTGSSYWHYIFRVCLSRDVMWMELNKKWHHL
jgi:hypothetical protein